MLIALLFTIAAPEAHAIMAKPVDFTHCNQQTPAGMAGTGISFTPPFRLGANGSLEFDKKGPLVKSHKRDGDAKETLVLLLNSPYGKPSDTQTVVLRRDGGRPVSLEQTIRFSPTSVQYPGGEWKRAGGEFTMGTRYGYEPSGKCFVRQIFSSANGKELISYDSEACGELLATAKKIGAAKLRECHDMSQQMLQVMRKHEAKAAGEGKLLRMGWGAMMPGQPEPMMMDSSLNHLMAVGSCQWTLSLYGHQVPPEESIFGGQSPGMAPVGGGTTDTRTETAQ